MALPTRFSTFSTSTATTVNVVATVPAVTIAAGSLVMVSFAAWNLGTAATIVDSKGNTWLKDVERVDGNVGVIDHYSSMLTTPLVSGDTITVSTSGGGPLNDLTLTVDYVTGYTNVGVEGTAAVAFGTSTAPTVSLTPASGASSALVYGYLSTMSTAPTVTEDADSAGGDTWHSATKAISTTAGNIVQIAGAYKNATPAATAQTYNPTLSASELWEAYLVSYPAVSAAGPIRRPSRLVGQAVPRASFI